MSTETAIRLCFLAEGMCSGWMLAHAFVWFTARRQIKKRTTP